MSQNYLARVNAFIEPYLAKNGYTLIQSAFTEEDHNWYLRLFIDLTEEEAAKRLREMEAEQAEAEAEAEEEAEAEVQDGEAEDEDAAEEEEETPAPAVSINDCVKVSRYLSKWLDKEDFIRETYTLEVCSRGFLQQ